MVHYSIDVDSVQGTEGEAVLMRKDSSSGEYLQVDGESAAIEYAGDWTGTWTVPNETETEPLTASLPFAEGHRGSIERLKVRFNYSNANGDDYIDSDEIVLCRGTYIGAGETFLGASGFSVSFPLDTDLVDPGKVKGVSATIMVDGTGVPLPEDSISISSDGTASVGCLMEYLAEQGVSLAYDGSSYPVWITLLYEDGDVSWENSSTGSVDMPNRGDYITGGYVGPLSGSDITPAGFRATFFLDAEVIGHPNNEQPYEGGRTLDLSSVTLVRNYSGTEITVEDVDFSPAESPTLSFTYNAPEDEQLAPGDYRVEVELRYNDPNADPPVVDLIDNGSKEFTVVGSTYRPPEFASAVVPRDCGDNIVEVGFTINLYDAAAQSGTATLMQRSYGSGDDYTAVEDEWESPSVPYHGDQTDSWSVPEGDAEMRAQLVIPDDVNGEIREMCVRFEYTLPDGSTGTIESDPFVFCLGRYVEFESGYATSEQFTATFRIDKDLVSPASVSVEYAGLDFDGRWIDLTSYTSILEDGAITISCAPADILNAGESFTAGEEYEVEVDLSCTVAGTVWDCFGWGEVQGTDDSASITMSVYVDGGQGAVDGDLLMVSGTVVYDFTPPDAYTTDDVLPSSVFIYWYDSDQTALDGNVSEYVDFELWPDPDLSVSGQFTYAYEFEIAVPDDARYFKIRVYDDSSLGFGSRYSDFANIVS